MGLRDISSRSAVLATIREYDKLGSEQFLAKYGYGPAKTYFLIHKGKRYPSKAIFGVAHMHQFPNEGPLPNDSFHGGAIEVVPKLRDLGFSVISTDELINVGDVVSNIELSIKFGIGNMGGMRRSVENNLLVLISDGTKSLYDDRWESDTLHYTGMGKSGDQTLTSQNRTVAESLETEISLHLFEVFDPGQYVYAGPVKLVDAPYQEIQIGEDGQERSVYMFPLQLLPGMAQVIPTQRQIIDLSARRSKTLGKKSLSELKKRAMLAKARPSRRAATTSQIVRDAAVVEYVKKAANGFCDLCLAAAPFTDKNGRPYLECHHVIRLADGGEDAISNAVALCANCHRKMHTLNRSQDRKELINRISVRDEK